MHKTAGGRAAISNKKNNFRVERNVTTPRHFGALIS